MLLASDRQSQQALGVYRYSSRRVLGEALPLRAGLWSSWQRCDCITAARRAAPWLASGQNSKCLTRHDLKIFTGSNVTLRKQHCWRPRRDRSRVTRVRVSLSVLFGGGDGTGASERADRKMHGHKRYTSILRWCCVEESSLYLFRHGRPKAWLVLHQCGCEKAHQRRRTVTSANLETWKRLSNEANVCTF